LVSALGATPERRLRSDGERSRNAILREATQLATIEGLEGLSIGRLADVVGMSKSGLFAHFGSKEELQLATFEAARSLFEELVVTPALELPTAGERLRGLCDNYLEYVQDAFPGGCFFAAVLAEMDTRPGAVRDRAVAFMDEWLGLLTREVQAAQAEGAIGGDEDVVQVAFQLEAYLFLANAQFVVLRAVAPIELARRAIEERLEPAAA
jgi:AcrR family transcriptional regulator